MSVKWAVKDSGVGEEKRNVEGKESTVGEVSVSGRGRFCASSRWTKETYTGRAWEGRCVEGVGD